jgi:DNA-binding CsgD family transcriptional regulator/transcriptional regulator with XRE-family HTH domain
VPGGGTRAAGSRPTARGRGTPVPADARTLPADADQAAFGEVLRRSRVRAGLSQEALAERAGLAPAAVSALERGVRRRPYPHTLAALAEALELPPAERAALAGAAGPSPHAGRPARASADQPLPPSNLPLPRTALIGRDRELAQVRDLLAGPTTHLVSVTGVGGAGKTRLGLQAAAELRRRFADGVWWVELAPLADPELVVPAAAAVLGVRAAPGTPLLEEGLALHNVLGDEVGAAWAQFNLGHVFMNRCDWARASPLLEESLRRYRALGDVRRIGIACTMLGAVIARLGELDLTAALLREGLAKLQAVGDRAYMVPCLLTVASVAAETGQPVPAARLLGAADALGEALGATILAPVNRLTHDMALETIGTRLGAAELAAARAQGRALRLDEALAEADLAAERVSLPAPRATTTAARPPDTLTPREHDVLRLLADGYSDRQIAATLGIAPATARVHVHHVLGKLGLRSRWQVGDRAKRLHH